MFLKGNLMTWNVYVPLCEFEEWTALVYRDACLYEMKFLNVLTFDCLILLPLWI